MLIAGRLAGFKYSHRGCVLALLDPIPTVRRYDIPNVRVDHFSRSARHDDHHHGGLFRNGRGASRRLHWRNCVHFDGADRESGALRWHEHERSPYREAVFEPERLVASLVVLQLQELAHERIMVGLELADKLLVRISAYRHVQEKVMGRLIK